MSLDHGCVPESSESLLSACEHTLPTLLPPSMSFWLSGKGTEEVLLP